jgi:ubiquinone/menaquinone biosynthesis C-methylase UbiE
MTLAAAPFDRVAAAYSTLWSDTLIGRLQRRAFWRFALPLFHSGDTVLDLGCGTGDDALHFTRAGINVVGIDASPEMVRVARERGVDARLCRIEDLECLELMFDGATSDFGALNCVPDLGPVCAALARLIQPGGFLAICVMGRVCAWETVWYLLRGDPHKAMRRWRGVSTSSLSSKVYYPTMKSIARAFAPAFHLEQAAGIGIFVPPSFVAGLPAWLLRHFERIDKRVADKPFFSAISDHRVLIFRRA